MDWIKISGYTKGRFFRNTDGDYIEIDFNGIAVYLPVSKVNEILEQQFELDSLERAARYAGITP